MPRKPKPDVLLRLEAERQRGRMAELKRKSESTIKHLDQVADANEECYLSRERLMNSTSVDKAPVAHHSREKRLYGGIGKLSFPKKPKR